HPLLGQHRRRRVEEYRGREHGDREEEAFHSATLRRRLLWLDPDISPVNRRSLHLKGDVPGLGELVRNGRDERAIQIPSYFAVLRHDLDRVPLAEAFPDASPRFTIDRGLGGGGPRRFHDAAMKSVERDVQRREYPWFL